MVRMFLSLEPWFMFGQGSNSLSNVPKSVVISFIVDDKSLSPATHREQSPSCQIRLASTRQGYDRMMWRVERSPSFEYLKLNLIPRLVRYGIYRQHILNRS